MLRLKDLVQVRPGAECVSLLLLFAGLASSSYYTVRLDDPKAVSISRRAT